MKTLLRKSMRYMTYDGEGAEVGYLTLAEACEQYYDVKFDTRTGTITVRRPKAEREWIDAEEEEEDKR